MPAWPSEGPRDHVRLRPVRAWPSVPCSPWQDSQVQASGSPLSPATDADEFEDDDSDEDDF